VDILSETLKWLPQGGAAGAVIVVVALFLKQQDKMGALLLTITDRFQAALDRIEKTTDDRLEAMDARHREIHEATQAQVASLVRDQIEANTKMTVAIEGLQSAVEDLKARNPTCCQGTADGRPACAPADAARG
jgi:hypothetical protein